MNKAPKGRHNHTIVPPLWGLDFLSHCDPGLTNKLHLCPNAGGVSTCGGSVRTSKFRVGSLVTHDYKSFSHSTPTTSGADAICCHGLGYYLAPRWGEDKTHHKVSTEPVSHSTHRNDRTGEFLRAPALTDVVHLPESPPRVPVARLIDAAVVRFRPVTNVLVAIHEGIRRENFGLQFRGKLVGVVRVDVDVEIVRFGDDHGPVRA